MDDFPLLKDPDYLPLDHWKLVLGRLGSFYLLFQEPRLSRLCGGGLITGARQDHPNWRKELGRRSGGLGGNALFQLIPILKQGFHALSSVFHPA